MSSVNSIVFEGWAVELKKKTKKTKQFSDHCRTKDPPCTAVTLPSVLRLLLTVPEFLG